jgi:hypothetical protein
MLKQTISFTDYNDEPRTVVEYFHLNEAEIVDMQARSKNGIQEDMQEAILSNDVSQVLDFITGLVHKSYGKKSADGLNFDKSPEILHKFVTSAYYSDFLLGLIEDNGLKGQEFVRGIMPAKLVERAAAQVQGIPQPPLESRSYEPDARERFAQAQAAKVSDSTREEIQHYQNNPPERFGQPDYPQVSVQEDPTPTAAPTPDQDQWNAFQQWQAQQEAAKAAASAPVSPDAFRVREEEPQPLQGLPRPPHEQRS